MRSQYLLLILLSILIAVIFFFFSDTLVSSQLDQINRLDGQIRHAQEQLNYARVLTGELNEVARIIHNSLTDATTLSIGEANEFTRQIAELADEYKIAIFSLNPRVSLVQNRILEQQFSLEIECTYIQLGRFLASIERYDYLVKVNALEVRPQTDKWVEVGNTRSTLYRVTMDMSIFKIVREA